MRYLDSFSWLVFSGVQQGYFCKYYPVFVNSNLEGYNKNVSLKHLVTEPLKWFKKLLGTDGSLTVHGNNKYYLDAVRAAKDFLGTLKQPDLSIYNRVYNLRLKTIEENCRRWEPIVTTIVLFGQQNIAFRGHRDDGKLMESEEIQKVRVTFELF